MRRTFLPLLLVVAAVAASAQTTLQVVPTTTVAAETGRNTSASDLFTTTSSGDLGAGNVSKADVHTLLYPGFSGKIYAHLMGWFCMNAGSTATGAGTKCGSHVQVGYNSNDPAEVHAQVTDMISRGFDGVIHDWYGPGNTRDDTETRNYMAEAEQHPNFTVALMVDKGAIEWYSCYPTCTATQALVQLIQYANATFFSSPAYMRLSGRPVVTNFDLDRDFTIDWNYVAANVPGNPIFLFQNNGGFTHGLSAGSYAWIMPDDANYGLDYLASFYSTGMNYPAELTVGAMYKGFNDTLASWSANRVMSQQCGQTWLQTFAKANSMYNSSNQLGAIQLVTWDDYEEGTELESGIDNCFSVSATLAGSTLAWTPNGDESTIDHYTVFISTDGQNLMPLGDFPAGTHQVDLTTFLPAEGTTYTLYVKAVGKPSLSNHMSGPVTFDDTAGVHISSPANGTTVGTPVTISGYAVSANSISAMIVYLDYNEVYRTYSGSVSTTLAMTAGQHLLVINAWDNTGALMQARSTIAVVTQTPNAALSLSSTTATAPATITASTAASTDPNSGGTIAASTINWGDGASSPGPSTSHTYSAPGTYTVTATVTDSYGLSSSTSRALIVTPPSITITSPSNGATLTSPVHVTATAASGLPISAIIAYLDHNQVYQTSSGSLDTMLPMTAGQHLLVTNAWDSAGTLMQAQVTITVVAAGPTAVLSLTPPSGVVPVSVTATTAGSSDPSASISSSVIYWGDGSTSPGPTATHTYITPGSYSLTATVTDSSGLLSTSGAQTVTAQPAGVFIAIPASGAAVSSPIHVSANAASAQTITSAAVYLDGSNVYAAAGAAVDASIAAPPGTHVLVVKTADAAGVNMQASVTVTVVAQAIVPSLSVTASVGSPLSVTASTAGSADANVGATLNSTINWGDGTSSTGPTATHTYAAAGSYTVTATVSDNYGVSANTSASVNVAALPPVTPKDIALTATPATTEVTRGQVAQFTLALTETGASDPISLSCSNLPAGATCSFAPPTLSPGSQPGTVVLSISTASMIAARRGMPPLFAFWLPGGLAILLLPNANARGMAGELRRSLRFSPLGGRAAVCLGTLLALLLLAVACGGKAQSQSVTAPAAATPTSSTASSTSYTVTVTATSGTVVRSANVTLIVH